MASVVAPSIKALGNLDFISFYALAAEVGCQTITSGPHTWPFIVE